MHPANLGEDSIDEAEKGHRIGRWVGVPLLIFIGAGVVAAVAIVVFLIYSLLTGFGGFMGERS